MKPKRTLIISMAVSGICAAFLFGTYWYVSTITQNDEEAHMRFEQARTHYEQTIGAVQKLAREARTVEEWEEVSERAGVLPEDAKRYFMLQATIHEMELLAAERDRLLLNVGELQAARTDPTAQNAQEFKKTGPDPDIPIILGQAKVLHERIGALLQTLPQTTDPDWSRALEYRKAYETYRSLAFLEPGTASSGEALDIISDAVHALQKANDAAPKDNQVERAIEFLYEKSGDEGGESGQSSPNRPRALPDIAPSSGPTRPHLH